MITLKAICDRDTANELVAVLSEHRSVGLVTHLAGVETRGKRDVVEADMSDRVMREVIVAIAALPGSPDIEVTVRLDAEQQAYRFADGRPVRVGEDADENVTMSAASMTLHRLSRIDYQYVLLMVSAAVIATTGLTADLPIAVVGAMAFSPDLGRINAMAFAMIATELRLLLSAASSLAAGMLIAIATSAAFAVFLEAVGQEDALGSVNERLVTFVTQIDPATITVAVAAGVAAMVVFIADRGRAAVGVGVSITTIPAASYAGIALAGGSWSSALDALIVLSVNIVAVVLAGVVTGLIFRRHVRRRVDQMDMRGDRPDPTV
jgi:uncharacterized hydrophobic protein (TIGR00271 family)